MSYRGKAAVVAATMLVAGTATAQSQKVNGPVADYWVSAATTSGFGMGGMGGGSQRPGIGAMMRGAMNPNAVNKSLTLQLGSSQSPTGAPQAEHLPPQGLGAGPSLPLVTPQRAPEPERPGELPKDFQRPQGRMLIFWGCGDKVGPGQPIVIDFAKMTQGQVPNIPTINVRTENPPRQGAVRTYGEWPNERTRTQVPGQGSLVGGHTIKGNYSPQIDFQLGPQEDFLAPLTLTGQTPTAMGGTRVTWNAVPRSTGYFAWMMGASESAGRGGGGGTDVVFWSSSQQSSFMGQLMDYIPPAEARRLVAANVVMSPQTTSCVIPPEVVKAAPMGLLSMIAYGDEVSRVDPPRPAAPAPWNISWRVKVRYKSTTGTMLGMPAMGGMSESEDDDRGGQQQRGQQQPQEQPSVGRAIGGALLRRGLGF
jgi:hypothetical protein